MLRLQTSTEPPPEYKVFNPNAVHSKRLVWSHIFVVYFRGWYNAFLQGIVCIYAGFQRKETLIINLEDRQRHIISCPRRWDLEYLSHNLLKSCTRVDCKLKPSMFLSLVNLCSCRSLAVLHWRCCVVPLCSRASNKQGDCQMAGVKLFFFPLSTSYISTCCGLVGLYATCFSVVSHARLLLWWGVPGEVQAHVPRITVICNSVNFLPIFQSLWAVKITRCCAKNIQPLF